MRRSLWSSGVRVCVVVIATASAVRTRRRLADGQFISRPDERTRILPGVRADGDSGWRLCAGFLRPHCPAVDNFFTDFCASALAQVFHTSAAFAR